MSTRYLFDTALNLDYSACCYLNPPCAEDSPWRIWLGGVRWMPYITLYKPVHLPLSTLPTLHLIPGWLKPPDQVNSIPPYAHHRSDTSCSRRERQ